MKKTVGQGAAQLFVKQDKQQGDFGAFVGEPIGITLAVALDQAVRFHFAEVVAQLVEAVAFVRQTVGREDGVMNLLGAPTSETSAAVQQDFHQTNHPRVMDLDSGKPGRSHGDGQGDPLEERKLDMHV